MKEIRFFDPSDPHNSCILDVERMTIDELVEMFRTQENQGRDEIEYLDK
jgi:hypothetical protein|tara:strand:+ start:313 stop:459 length:147 start_codon:yes stop_codon:yes gene_type:complete